MIHIIGNFVDLPEVNNLNPHTTDNSIIFVGKMNYDPNVIAVEYFVNDILPAVRDTFPSVTFTIVGSHPARKVLDLANKPGVSVTGFVEDLSVYYNRCTILVAPMLTGAGVQNKIIQGMAHRCCVATTPIGAEGLDINGEIAIYKNTDEWVTGIKHLLGDRDKRIDMGEKAYEYVKTKLSIDCIRKEFEAFIDDACKRHK